MIEDDIQALGERLADIEAHQWTANGRLRQDTAGLTHDVGVATLILLAIWAEIPFHWWYLPLGLLLSWARGHARERAWRQEQIREGWWPAGKK